MSAQRIFIGVSRLVLTYISEFIIYFIRALRDTFSKIVETDKPQTTMWRIRFACWVTKTINAQSYYVILINFPLQQWLHESASM
jgi:hypothetical protein